MLSAGQPVQSIGWLQGSPNFSTLMMDPEQRIKFELESHS